jgi:IS6 family transposase
MDKACTGPNVVIFKWRQFEPEVILLAVGWYLRFSLSYRDVEELLAERGLRPDHVTVWRWVQRYGPQMEQRLRRRLKPTKDSWRVDETYIRVKGKWVYLYRAVDSTGATINFLLSAKRGNTREAAIRPNKPSTFAGEMPFSILALALQPAFPIRTDRKTSGFAHFGKSRGSKSRRLAVTRHIRSSDRYILTRKCCDRFRSVGAYWVLSQLALCSPIYPIHLFSL